VNVFLTVYASQALYGIYSNELERCYDRF